MNDKKAHAVICADLHMRDTPPRCRIDADWFETMRGKLEFIDNLANDLKCPVLCAGDICDEPYRNPKKPTPRLIILLSRYLRYWIAVYGNHDLPKHNHNRKDEAGMSAIPSLYILEDGGTTAIPNHTIKGIGWGESDLSPEVAADVLMLHTLCWHEEKPYPEAPDTGNAYKIMEKYPEYQLIITGDNHESFAVTHNDRLLINPGSVLRLNTKQKHFQPVVYVWYGGTDYETVNIPIDHKAVSDQHIQASKRVEDNLEAFISTVDGDYELDLDFITNLDTYMDVNNTESVVRDIVKEAVE